jgi:hypothetical protein
VAARKYVTALPKASLQVRRAAGSADTSVCVLNARGEQAVVKAVGPKTQFVFQGPAVSFDVETAAARLAFRFVFEDGADEAAFRRIIFETQTALMRAEFKPEDERVVQRMMFSSADDMVDEEEEEEEEVVEDRSRGARAGPGRALSPETARSRARLSAGEPALKGRRPPAVAEAEVKDGLLEVGRERVYVVQGDYFDAFAPTEDGDLRPVATRSSLRDMAGQSFTPSKALLHERESKLALLRADRPDEVLLFDIERGKAVQTVSAAEVGTVRNIAPVRKNAQRAPEAMLLGANNSAVFSLDPRERPNQQVASRRVYSRPFHFSALATTEEGKVAVGSETGDIRLFNDISKVAKTHLPGLGDAIFALDATRDGAWVLATTAEYLVLIPTEAPDGGKGGFDKSLGDNKPLPHKLSILPPDLVRHRVDRVHFTPAHFDSGPDGRERWIVTSTGRFVVVWDFVRARAGDITAYRVTECADTVVADDFRFGTDQVVVTLLNDVILEPGARLAPKQRARAKAAARRR